jgi:hypothetical protein
MDKFITYKKYYNTDQLQVVIDILNANNIKYEVEDYSSREQDSVFGTNSSPKIILKLLSEDFNTVNDLLSNLAHDEIENVDTDHYLFSYENDELLEIIFEEDAWSPFDVELAKNILNKRGVAIPTELVSNMKKKRIKELSKKEKVSDSLIIAGYLFAFLGGLLGIVIGLSLWTSKKTLPDGTVINAFEEKDRQHGQIITIGGAILAIMYFFVIVKRS